MELCTLANCPSRTSMVQLKEVLVGPVERSVCWVELNSEKLLQNSTFFWDGFVSELGGF